MNKRIQAIIEFVKVHKKETIGVAVALGIAVVGVGGYAISKHYSNTDTNNIALAEKKEDPKADEDKKLEENKAADNEEVTVEEQEDGSLIVKDKDGNIIADSSKGDDVSKIVEEKKEAGITEPKNLEEQAISLVGKTIYEKLVKGYTEKQWGKRATELPSFIIKRLPVRFIYDNNYFNDKYQGIPIGGYTRNYRENVRWNRSKTKL